MIGAVKLTSFLLVLVVIFLGSCATTPHGRGDCSVVGHVSIRLSDGSVRSEELSYRDRRLTHSSSAYAPGEKLLSQRSYHYDTQGNLAEIVTTYSEESEYCLATGSRANRLELEYDHLNSAVTLRSSHGNNDPRLWQASTVRPIFLFLEVWTPPGYSLTHPLLVIEYHWDVANRALLINYYPFGNTDSLVSFGQESEIGRLVSGEDGPLGYIQVLQNECEQVLLIRGVDGLELLRAQLSSSFGASDVIHEFRFPELTLSDRVQS